MKQKKQLCLIVLGVVLCAAVLVLSVVLQKAGYLTFIDSDMAAELMLARHQASTGHIIETQWMHSTEIRILSPNLLYAISFLFTDSYCIARIIGNTICFALGMAAHMYLCQKMKLSYGLALCTAALLPLGASHLYAGQMIFGGYYILHLLFAYLGTGLWLSCAEYADKRSKGLWLALGFIAFFILEGLLSVRYVLCFACPMLVTGMLDMLFASEEPCSSSEDHNRFFVVTMLGFAACVFGYVVSEIVYPHIFVSGVGAASSFLFNPLDGPAMLNSVMTVFADFLKLLGWRGSVSLFSLEGIINLCIAATVVLGVIISVRVLRNIRETDKVSRTHKRMILYALYAFLVNLFCYVFIKGTYLNRYLIDAVLFFVPMLAVILHREKNKRLLVVFLLVLCAGLGVSSLVVLRDTIRKEDISREKDPVLMAAANHLLENGYTHGYGTFWNVRLMEERTEGALTFTGIIPEETESNAVSPNAMTLIRWGEMDNMSDLDICSGKTFLLLTPQEQELVSDWLEHIGAPIIFQNEVYVVYGFESSQAFTMDMLKGRMTLHNAQALHSNAYQLGAGGKLRMPPSWREAGSYTFSFSVEGEPAQDSFVRIYSGRHFDIIAEQPLTAGENTISYTLAHDDKYSMTQILAGEADNLIVSSLTLDKAQ